MTFSRVAPGPQLGAGRLRVDAARAIAKLREYQLADRTAWILEAIRAAVASSATRIELRGDANDIWLAWDGAAWPVEDLPRLFDELVSPEPIGGRHHLRLLAAGVNSALGMNPAYVDVIAIGETATHRARYTPEVLDDSGELGESAMRKVTAEPIERPPAARPGMVVHLRRRVSLEVLSYLLHAPPELAVARAACRDLAVPLVIGDETFERTRSTDVLRVPLGEQLDGFIAAIDPARASEHEATIEIAERGVVLVRYAIDLFGTGLRRAPVPIRVYVDAPRMPTNASRSQVRHEDYPIHAAEQRAVRVVHELIGRLGTDMTNPRARDAVIALLATEVAIGTANWQSAVLEISKPLHRLAELPLVRDAVGKPRPLASIWNGLVHEGAKPFDVELAPWLSDVIWIPHGDPAARLVEYGLLDARGLRRRVRWARRQRNAHRRFYDHRPVPATLAPRTKPRIRAPLGVAVEGSCVPDRLFEGLIGEVCVDIDPKRGGELIVLLEGREIERQKFESPFAFVVVIDSKRVTPGDRYRGVVRDTQYKHVERAMRAGIVRAIEALFVAKAPGVELGPEAPLTDLQLARAALSLAGELGVAMRGPLTIAPVWLAGQAQVTRVSLAELLRAGVVGIVDPGTLDPLRIPAGRMVIEATNPERPMLARLLHGRVVGYDRARAPNPRLLAHQLLKLGANALVIRDGDTVGAIAPAKQSSLTLYHMGTKLESRGYTPSLFSCAIALDSPALVPSPEWSKLADDAGVASRSYLSWEVKLARAAASSLAGEPPEELVGPGARSLESELGRLLCIAVLHTEPAQLLGEALLAKLLRAKIVSVYGVMVLRSLDDLVALPGEELAYVTEDGIAIPGFTAMVATEIAARALAKLVGRRARDATGELEDRRREALFAARLASHRTQLPRPVALPPGTGITVPIDSAIMRGVVGVGTGALAVEVFVEGRPFTRVEPRPALPGIAPVPELPLVAAIEVAIEQCGPTFDGLPYEVIAAMAVALRGAARALVVAIANETPELLATTGPARTLLARLLVQPEPPDAVTLRALCSAPILATVQGTRISVEQALGGSHFISIATWQEPWLTDDANPDVLDAPIVFMPEGESETHAILVGLHGGLVSDVTEGVRKLQAQRRMARGLLPTPKVRGVPHELVRELTTLGPIGKKLGHGEIGLVSPVGGTLGESTLLIHDHGVMRGRVVLDVMPPIQLAVEAPELVSRVRDPLDLNARLSALGLSEAEPHAMTGDAQALASALVVAVTRELPLLPAPLRRGVLRAWIARRIPDLDGVPLFETDGPILDHTAIASQIARFGNVWAVPALRSERPLDDERIVLRMTADDIALARTHHRPFIDATHELALDAIARQNRARPMVAELAISHHGVLATATLDGDGITSPRGEVGVLVPGIAAQVRGLRAHRQMRPFDVAPDPCKWPTIAVIDDARLEPDRTWANPERRGVWTDVVARVREASEAALARIVEPPHDALVIDPIDARAIDGLATLRSARGTQLRGLVWLTDAPCMATSTVDLVNTDRASVARWDGLAGRLFAFTPEAVELDAVLAELLEASHARLLRALLVRRADIDPDVLAVHVALGLAAHHVLPRDAKGISFDCFAPRALEPAELAAMFGGTDPVPAVTLADDAEPGVVTFVDDDMALARAIRAQLGLRIRRVEPSPFVPPRVTNIVMPRTAPGGGEHVLANLVRVLDHRLQDLGISGFHWLITERQTALVRFDGTIHLGGANHRLLAIASAHAANSPWAPAAIDAVTAHVVTVLNVALTEITDTTEAHALGTLLAGTVSWSS